MRLRLKPLAKKPVVRPTTQRTYKTFNSAMSPDRVAADDAFLGAAKQRAAVKASFAKGLARGLRQAARGGNSYAIDRETRHILGQSAGRNMNRFSAEGKRMVLDRFGPNFADIAPGAVGPNISRARGEVRQGRAIGEQQRKAGFTPAQPAKPISERQYQEPLFSRKMKMMEDRWAAEDAADAAKEAKRAVKRQWRKDSKRKTKPSGKRSMQGGIWKAAD